MNIYLIKNGQNYGPYSKSEVMTRIQSGSFSLDDLAWFEGCSGAVTIAQVLGRTPPPKAAPTRKPAAKNFQPSELAQIANWQKGMLAFLIPWFGFGFGPAPISLLWIQQIGFCGAHIGLILQCYEEAKLLRKNVWFWTLLAAIPVVNIFVVGRLFSRANKILKDNGIPVGVWGAKYPHWCVNNP